ncbi:MAG: DUF2334 domain-containing protein [Myxococcales bacterium]|nr:DUF2334 domain-containing protein [Myxococcales bacterium]
MRLVILRDDDANATTPLHWIQACVGPFVDRGLPVQLAMIPEVATDIRLADGRLEGFLTGPMAGLRRVVPISANTALVDYVRGQRLLGVVQHGLSHRIVGNRFEFDEADSGKVAQWLDRGTRCLLDASLPKATTFVAPQDTLSRGGFTEVRRRFRQYSTGWFERSRLPVALWPKLLWMRVNEATAVWKTEGITLFSHPGCLLSYNKPVNSMASTVIDHIRNQVCTVLVLHHWEYWLNGFPDELRLDVLAEIAEFLEKSRDIEVVTFDCAAERLG